MAADESLEIPVYYDFSSTICYFTHRVMERLAPRLEELAVELVWSPLDLTAITAWERGASLRGERRRNVERLSRELDVPVKPPEHWMDSRPAMAVSLALAGSRDETRWRRAVWEWIYREAHSLDEDGALEAIAKRAGLIVEPPTAQAVEEIERRTREAHAIGVRGVPTFLLDVWPVGIGIQDDETMLSFLERFVEKRAVEPRAH